MKNKERAGAKGKAAFQDRRAVSDSPPNKRGDEDMDKDADVTPEERRDLARMAKQDPESEDRALERATLDETDEEGTPLEEKGLEHDVAGHDLDVPGAADDDEDEEIGEEDEENNAYSLGGENHDDDEEDY